MRLLGSAVQGTSSAAGRLAQGYLLMAMAVAGAGAAELSTSAMAGLDDGEAISLWIVFTAAVRPDTIGHQPSSNTSSQNVSKARYL
ncbi:hypothetical protein ElyMa_003144100 [Elysia marginata]|uniref:Uncharacterized protein n=1 Tax=Elysia marginata TaxID=1093978 RepID=A0AAV4IVK1_9GAST|nr:hypothetical protein ElyMa_003144100 [Elysia marginata]